MPAEFYPTDSNGVNLQSQLEPCMGVMAPAQVAVCRAWGYGECEGNGQKDCCLPSITPFPLPSETGKYTLLTHAIFLLGIPFYGNWCGPGHSPAHPPAPWNCNAVVPPPKDDLDRCCCEHDLCFALNGCNGPGWVRCVCKRCDCDLAACAIGANCGRNILCWLAR